MPADETRPTINTPPAPDYLRWGVRPVTSTLVPDLLAAGIGGGDAEEPPLRVLVLRGAADVFNAPVLTDACNQSLDGARKGGAGFAVLLDLSGVSVLDSSALSVLLEFNKKVKDEGGRIGIYGLNGRPARVFHLTGMQRILPVYADETDAAHARGQLKDLTGLPGAAGS